MLDIKNFKKLLFSLNPSDFDQLCLEVFEYQWSFNELYQNFCSRLGRTPANVKKLSDIPFLPIGFFKSYVIKTGFWSEEKIYQSSGTTIGTRSKHYIRSNNDYLDLAKKSFEDIYGPLEDYQLYALLPSYLEQGDSSLISMVDHFMKYTKPASSYFLKNHVDLFKALNALPDEKICLFGVTYALLDFADKYDINLKNVMVMETGGMKGRRNEIIRADLHEYLLKKLKPASIHSEYGMTELTSQAYFNGELFTFPTWAQVMIRDINDPFSYLNVGETGGINIIDLGNIHSCAFIETMDLGKKHQNEQFEVLGRYDNSDIRGCNLMVS